MVIYNINMLNKLAQICFCCVLLLTGYTGFAQEQGTRKKLEHNIRLGTGVSFETGSHAKSYQNLSAAVQLAYGLDVFLSERFSLMPEVGLRAGMPVFLFAEGADFDGMAYADLSLSLRYHKPASNVIYGLAPVVSYMVVPDTYYVDADPSDPLNRKETFNRADFGVRPSMTFRHGRHFQCGVEAHIGILNAMRQYPEYNRTGAISVHHVMLFCGWHF